MKLSAAVAALAVLASIHIITTTQANPYHEPTIQHPSHLLTGGYSNVILPSQPSDLPQYIYTDDGSAIWRGGQHYLSQLLGYPSPLDVKKQNHQPITSSDIKQTAVEVMSKVGSWLDSYLPSLHEYTAEYNTQNNIPTSESSQYNYFRFLPEFLGNVSTVDGHELQWQSSTCFNDARAVFKQLNPTTYQLRLTLDNPKNWHCSDLYLFATLEGVKVESFFKKGEHIVEWKLSDATPKESITYDLGYKGLRIFQFLDSSMATNLQYVKDTVALFTPLTTQAPSADASNKNADFMRLYANQPLQKRNIRSVPIDESLIQSGDFFGILRLDGLDPMLAWAMGSVTGHVTAALWMDGQLYITESTTKDSYWPTNGVQRTPYAKWITQARAAGFNVVWAPLTPEARAKFDVTQAIQWFKTVEGLDYGYENMLSAWIDTLTDNYPCLPDRPDKCLVWEHFEVISTIVERQSWDTGYKIFGGAWNARVGTDQLNISDVLYIATEQHGMGSRIGLPTMIELDSYKYHTTRFDQPVVDTSMVCCTFVCGLWKASGMFGELSDDIRCGEFTNWDDYTLDWLQNNSTGRPSQCQQADPTNNLCQLEGEYQVHLNQFATKQPYPHMAEHCPSKGPDYLKPANC